MTGPGLGGAVSLLVACAFGAPAHAQANWRLATGYWPEVFHTVNIRQFAHEVETATQGKPSIAVHPNNTLFKLAEIRDAVQSGKIEMGEVIMTGLVKDMPLAGADAVPFVVAGYADARRLWKYQRAIIAKQFQERGLRVLFAVPWPPQDLYTAKPVRRVADFKGLKMRTYNTTTVRIAELLGTVPVEVPATEVGKALAEGRMSAMITSSITGVETRAWQHLPYYYEINAWIPKNIVFANERAFSALSKPSQDAILKAAADAEERGWEMSEKAAVKAKADLAANKVKISDVPDELRPAIARMGERFALEWIKQAGQEANDIFIPYYTEK